MLGRRAFISIEDMLANQGFTNCRSNRISVPEHLHPYLKCLKWQESGEASVPLCRSLSSEKITLR